MAGDLRRSRFAPREHPAPPRCTTRGPRPRSCWRYLDHQAVAQELAMMFRERRNPTIGWFQRRLCRPELAVMSEEPEAAPLGAFAPSPPVPSGPT